MAGRVASAIGLIFAAIFMLVIGYILTLDVYRYEGSYVIFYAGRYYGGIACMIVGGILFFAGILLPVFWPSEKVKRPPPTHEKQRATIEENSSVSSSSLSKSAAARSIELKIRGISMQSTFGSEAVQVLQLLAQQKGARRKDLSQIIEKTGIDEDKMRKVIRILSDLDLIERSDLAGKESYRIAQDIKEEVLAGVNKVCRVE